MKKLKGRKLLTTLLLVIALCCTSLFGISAIAAETTKVGKVKINVTNDNGRIKFSSAEAEKYMVTNPTGEIAVSVGDSNVDFEVTIKAKDGYYFDRISKGDVSFKKDSSGVKCTDVSYNSQEIRADIEVKTIKGKLEKPDSAWWDDDDFGVAYWDEVEQEGVTGYLITINGHEVTTNGRTHADLRNYLEWGKNNYFKVKATSNKSGVSDSSYTKSDNLDLTDDGDYWDDYYYYDYDYGVRPGERPNNNYGWIQYNGKWFFIDTNGQIKTGWLEHNGYKYYLNKDGEMLTGWQKVGSYWYCFASDGHMLRNTVIKSANGQFDYYLNSDGRMQTNRWQKNNIGWYYIDNDQPVRSCEKKIDGKYYRFNDYGYMITGWWTDPNGNWYYYWPDGSKAIDTIIWFNGYQYRLDKNGRWIS